MNLVPYTCMFVCMGTPYRCMLPKWNIKKEENCRRISKLRSDLYFKKTPTSTMLRLYIYIYSKTKINSMMHHMIFIWHYCGYWCFFYRYGPRSSTQRFEHDVPAAYEWMNAWASERITTHTSIDSFNSSNYWTGMMTTQRPTASYIHVLVFTPVTAPHS